MAKPTPPKLKPCRKCGRSDEIEYGYDSGIFKIRCQECGFFEAEFSRAKVEAAWNRRNRRAAAKEK